MTIQENNASMKRQLLNQAKISRQRYETLSVSRDAHKQQLAIENLTRAIHFEAIAHNILKVWLLWPHAHFRPHRMGNEASWAYARAWRAYAKDSLRNCLFTNDRGDSLENVWWSSIRLPQLMERDELRKAAMEWWNSKTRDQKRYIAECNKTFVSNRQFFKSPELITRAYLRANYHKNVKSTGQAEWVPSWVRQGAPKG